MSRATFCAAFCGVLSSTALAADGDWPSYNRTLTSERLAPQTEITRDNVGKLEVLCSYDVAQDISLQTGPIVVDGTLYGTTAADTFAIDAATCKERWRVSASDAGLIKVNRGVAWSPGRVIRGLMDGRVIAYDARTGKELWATKISDPTHAETIPAAPIVWDGRVYIGHAGGDFYGVKGRMFALDAATGKVVWEYYLVPKDHPATRPSGGPQTPEGIRDATWGNTAEVPVSGGATWTSYTIDPATGLLYVPGGNPGPDFYAAIRPGANLYAGSVVVLDARTGTYRAHYEIVPADYHDWDVSSTPVVTKTRAGKKHVLIAPKDGHLYGYDAEGHTRRFATPVTTIENIEAPLTRDGTRFCPGAQGGVEWNGPAYDPKTNLAITGATDWCSTVWLADEPPVKGSRGMPWTGGRAQNMFGKQDPVEKWGGWITATDADTGAVKWKLRTPAPALSGITPTASGLMFAGDMAGNLYVLDTATGKELAKRKMDGALGGGIVSYTAGGGQRLAVITGTYSPIWPVPKVMSKIVVLGLRKQ